MKEKIVEVSVMAPDEENTEYAGEIRIENKEDNSDYGIITVALTTSRNKVTMKPFLNFLQSHPILYQLLLGFLNL